MFENKNKRMLMILDQIVKDYEQGTLPGVLTSEYMIPIMMNFNTNVIQLIGSYDPDKINSDDDVLYNIISEMCNFDRELIITIASIFRGVDVKSIDIIRNKMISFDTGVGIKVVAGVIGDISTPMLDGLSNHFISDPSAHYTLLFTDSVNIPLSDVHAYSIDPNKLDIEKYDKVLFILEGDIINMTNADKLASVLISSYKDLLEKNNKGE